MVLFVNQEKEKDKEFCTQLQKEKVSHEKELEELELKV